MSASTPQCKRNVWSGPSLYRIWPGSSPRRPDGGGARIFLRSVRVALPSAAPRPAAWPARGALVEDRMKNAPGGGARRSRAERIAARRTALAAEWRKTLERQRSERPIAPAVLAAEVWDAIKADDWILANGTANGWARRLWDWRPERSYGGSGGAGARLRAVRRGRVVA